MTIIIILSSIVVVGGLVMAIVDMIRSFRDMD